MICQKCSATNPDDAIFCCQCSEPLENAPPQTQPQPQPPMYEQAAPATGQPQPAPPVYGQQTMPMYGQPTIPVYGQQTMPVYGQQIMPAYGQPQYPMANYGQPPYTQPNYGGLVSQAGNGAATAAMVCGIISLPAYFAGVILGIIAVVQGVRAKRLGYKGGKATAGIVMGSIGIVLCCIFWVIIVLLFIAMLDTPYYRYPYIY
ncbi:MAG: hypothetical protein FWE59_06040 [Oscillospiraceae bacterium]|nr:hypothetical protein [Oscillospiraceae bacterium]